MAYPARPFAAADFTADVFLPYVGRTFQWERPAAGHASMELLEVQRCRMQPGLTREPFSLLFAMKDQAPLGPGLPRLVHPDFERCEVFLSRVTAPKYERIDPGGMYYEAVFS